MAWNDKKDTKQEEYDESRKGLLDAGASAESIDALEKLMTHTQELLTEVALQGIKEKMVGKQSKMSSEYVPYSPLAYTLGELMNISIKAGKDPTSSETMKVVAMLVAKYVNDKEVERLKDIIYGK